MDLLAFKLLKQATAQGWVSAQDKVLIGVSGGADSCALACLIAEWRTQLPLEIRLVHFNHQVRLEADQDQSFCCQLAEKLGVEIEIFTPDSPLKKKGLQAEARSWRRRVLLGLAEKWGAKRIGLGHHQDDLAETLLWRIMRGTSILGLSPMLPLDPPWFRPLLGLAKVELIDYLGRIDQSWVEDVSNQEDDYCRNRIRHHLIPLMNQLSGTQVAKKLAKLAGESASLNKCFSQTIGEEKWTAATLSYADLTSLPSVYGLELIHRFLYTQGCQEIQQAQLEQIFQLALAGKGGWQVALKGQLIAKGKKQQIWVEVSG